MLQQTRGRGKNEIRRRRAEHDQIEIGGFYAGRVERVRRRIKGQIARRLAVGGDASLADAGARNDPLVTGLDALLEILVGDDLFRQIAAGAEDA